MTTIPIFFTFDRHYVLAACVAFHTMLRHASKDYRYHLYVVHTDLKEKHKKRIVKVVGKFENAEVSFKDVSDVETGWEQLRFKSHFSKEIYYKLIAADLFPEWDRILLSDVDVIFKGDIAPSYFLFENEDFYYAGPRPIMENGGLTRYKKAFDENELDKILEYEVSAGFMLINLEAIRRDGMQKQLTQFYNKNLDRLILPEQDCIALCCKEKTRFLPNKYVVCNFMFHRKAEDISFNPRLPEADNRELCIEKWNTMLEEVVQLHYVGADKPWNSLKADEYRQWLEACRETGMVCEYIRLQPMFMMQRLKRYNLKRFLTKVRKRLSNRKNI